MSRNVGYCGSAAENAQKDGDEVESEALVEFVAQLIHDDDNLT